MEELKKALQIRERFNKLPFDEFTELLERYIGETIPKKEKEQFKYTGLLNTDFFLMWAGDKLTTGEWQLTIPDVSGSASKEKHYCSYCGKSSCGGDCD